MSQVENFKIGAEWSAWGKTEAELIEYYSDYRKSELRQMIIGFREQEARYAKYGE